MTKLRYCPCVEPIINRLQFAAFFCLTALTCVACRGAQALPTIDQAAVMQVVRTYAGVRPPNPSPVATTHRPDEVSSPTLESEEPYKARIRALFEAANFQELDKEVRTVRNKRERVEGGTWKLLLFYEAVATPDAAGNADWEARRTKIKQWIASRPDSAAAQIALAGFYEAWAWAARGSGYSNSVSQSGWDLFGQRTQMAKKALMDAAVLKEKCPYWYEVMQNIAEDEGWDKTDARELLDQAAAFEPTYYHYYRDYANFLLPKWYGEEGETQGFAEEIAKRLPEPDASITYFEIASILACQCDKERDSLAGMSWPRVKQGYSELQRRYGVSDIKLNRFAYMAYVANDKEAARQAFLLIPIFSRSVHVWRSNETFESAKAWSDAP